jgi:hypothetical protein
MSVLSLHLAADQTEEAGSPVRRLDCRSCGRQHAWCTRCRTAVCRHVIAWLLSGQAVADLEDVGEDADPGRH